jgi:hypothetical protein
MPARLLLYLDTSAMHCFAWRQGHVRLLDRFSVNEEGIGGFSRFVQAHRSALFSMLVDLMEEGFQHEVLPHVRGPDRAAMLERKGNQAFFGSPLTTAISLGREPAGRRDERLLFVSLTRNAAIEPWLAALRVANAPLTGIFSPPLLLDRLMQRTAADKPRCLLVNFTPGGMRQTYFDGGRLRFSRLAQSLDDIPIGLEDQCAAEILKTHSYLVGQRMIPRGTPLPVHVLVDHEDYNRLHPALRDSDELRYQHVPIGQIADRIGLLDRLQGSNALPVLLHWMARDTGGTQLASPAERRYYALWKIRQAILGTGLALFAATMLYAGKIWFDTQQMQSETEMLVAQIQTQNLELAGMRQILPDGSVSLEALRPAMETLERLRAQDTSPRAWLARLADSLDAFPGVMLEQVDWRYQEPAPGTRLIDGSSGRALLSLPREMAGDRRAQQEAARDFVADLAAGNGNVRLIRMPVELGSDQAYRSSTEDQPDLARPQFEVEFSQGNRP